MSREFVSKTVGLLLVVGLGASACGGNPESTSVTKTSHTSGTCDGSSPLSEVRLIGGAKSGGINAVNGGECAGVYNPKTLKDLGVITANEAFIIECSDGPKPASFRVKTDQFEGDVNLDNGLISQLDTEFAEIPSCY